LAIGVLAAAGVVFLHLVARQRPAAYLLPTTRFIPDRRTLVSRVATRPRDLLLLVLRVALLLCVGAAFARPVLTPTRGSFAHVVLLDRSRAVANPSEAVARARALVSKGTPFIIVVFDSAPTVLTRPAWDSLAIAARAETPGSLSAALIAARRASVSLAEHVDSVQLSIVSPVAASELDAAFERARDEWPGAIRVSRVALRSDSSATWRLESALSAADQLGPAMASTRGMPGARITRLIRGVATAEDSSFARNGGTVVRWDSTAAPQPAAEGLAAGDDVIVAALGRVPVSLDGRVLARWADGTRAASEQSQGNGCMRQVGVALPSAGDLALHPPFQRIARGLLAPCGLAAMERSADSTAMSRLSGTPHNAARADALRNGTDRSSPLASWLLALAILLAIAELLVRAQIGPEIA
jgi:hypothetical protein